jgi:ADP-ribose pyrophosphatase YjhB (NUDIX family)
MSDREYPTRPVVGVGAVVVVSRVDRERLGIEDGLPGAGVVLVRRRFEPLAGQWSLPGGSLEIGETLEAGVAREVLEETGLSVNVGPVIEVFDRIMLDESSRVRYHFVLVDYLCHAIGGRMTAGSDAGEVVIADPRALDGYELTGKALSVIARGLSIG